MNEENVSVNLQHLSFQRNAFLTLSLFLSIAITVLAFLLLWKKERVVILPAALKSEIWIEGENFSPSFLEQYTEFVSNLVLNKTPASAPLKRATILKLTDPVFYDTFKKKLLEEEVSLMAQGASYSFFPVQITVNAEELTGRVVGDRATYVNGKKISENRESYLFGFRSNGSGLLLTAISKEEVKG